MTDNELEEINRETNCPTCRRLVSEVLLVRLALAERKVVEQARGILSETLGLSEADAFRRLRELSNKANRKLVEVARELIEQARRQPQL